MGNHCVNVPDGSTAGSTGNCIQSTAPVTISGASQLSSVACYTTLGGRFALGTIASSESDLAIFSYQNPTQTAQIPGKNLVIQGLSIDAVNFGVAVSAVTLIEEWFVLVDCSSSACSAVDSATAGTKGGRKIPLGYIAISASAAVGTPAIRPIETWFRVPIVIAPGNFFTIGMRPISGPANTGQITRGIVRVDGYFE